MRKQGYSPPRRHTLSLSLVTGFGIRKQSMDGIRKQSTDGPYLSRIYHTGIDWAFVSNRMFKKLRVEEKFT